MSKWKVHYVWKFSSSIGGKNWIDIQPSFIIRLKNEIPSLWKSLKSIEWKKEETL